MADAPNDTLPARDQHPVNPDPPPSDLSSLILDDETQQVQEEFLKIIREKAKIPETGVTMPKVTIVGAGISGLCAGYELKRRGFDVQILESSSRVGGRIITFRDPIFAPGLHAEGGAMRIPRNHCFVHAYLKSFHIDDLFDFEMENKFIHLTDYGSTLTVARFEELLKARDPTLLSKVFPGLTPDEQGKTADQLFELATNPALVCFDNAKNNARRAGLSESKQIETGYAALAQKYDRYTLRSFLKEVANWSNDAITLYDLSNAHVVLDNGFIESFKDAFLSSNSNGKKAGMQQIHGGMDRLPKAFISPHRGPNSLETNITFGARVTKVNFSGNKVETTYVTLGGGEVTVSSEYIIFTVPYPAQRRIQVVKSFSRLKSQAIRDVNYVQVTKVLLQYKRRWWENEFDRENQGDGGGLVTNLGIRYAMFPPTEGNRQCKPGINERGVIMAAYTFGNDSTALSSMTPEDRVRQAVQDLERVFPNSKGHVETGTSQAFSQDQNTGGAAFCYFKEGQKTMYHRAMRESEWDGHALFAGEHASYAHGWIQGAMGVALRCVQELISRRLVTGQGHGAQSTG